MKKIYIISILTLIISLISGSTLSFADNFKPIGGVVQLKKTPTTKLYFSCKNSDCKEIVFVLEEDSKTSTSNLTLPHSSDLDSYQEKWSTLLSLATDTSLTMPPIPEFRYIYLSIQCQKTLMRQFHFMDDSKNLGKSNSIKKLFLNHLLTNLGM